MTAAASMNYTMGFSDNNGNYATISGWSTGGGDFRAFKKQSQITKPSQFFVITSGNDLGTHLFYHSLRAFTARLMRTAMYGLPGSGMERPFASA